MATDRNGNPLAVDNLVRIPGRFGMRPFMVEPTQPGEATQIVWVYPEQEQPVEALTGRVLSIDDDTVYVKVDGVEAPQMFEARLLEKTA